MQNENLNNLVRMDFVHSINEILDTIESQLTHIKILAKNYALRTKSAYIIATDMNTNDFKSIRLSDHHIDDGTIDLSINFTSGQVAKALNFKLTDKNDWYKLTDGFRFWYAQTTADPSFAYHRLNDSWWHSDRSTINEVEENYLKLALSQNLLQTYFDTVTDRETTYLAENLYKLRNYVCQKYLNVDLLNHKGVNIQIIKPVKNQIMGTVLLTNHTVADFWLGGSVEHSTAKTNDEITFERAGFVLSGRLLALSKITETQAKANYVKCQLLSHKPIDTCQKLTVRTTDGKIIKDVFISYKKYPKINKNFIVHIKNVHTEQEYLNAIVTEIHKCSEAEIKKYNAKTFDLAVFKIVNSDNDTKIANVMTLDGVLIENVVIPETLNKTLLTGDKVRMTNDGDEQEGYVIRKLALNEQTKSLVSLKYTVTKVIKRAVEVSDEPAPELKVTVTPKSNTKRQEPELINFMTLSDDNHD